MKKLLALVLAAVMVFAMAAPAFAVLDNLDLFVSFGEVRHEYTYTNNQGEDCFKVMDVESEIEGCAHQKYRTIFGNVKGPCSATSVYVYISDEFCFEDSSIEYTVEYRKYGVSGAGSESAGYYKKVLIGDMEGGDEIVFTFSLENGAQQAGTYFVSIDTPDYDWDLKNNCAKIKIVEPEIIQEKASDCFERGYDAYQKCACGKLFDMEGNEISEIPYKSEGGSHDWGEVEYTWSDDGSSCTATRICKSDNSHEETATATIDSETLPGTCTNAGKTVYTATFTADWVTEKTQTKEVTGDLATDHDWSVSYEWEKEDEDWYCTAYRKCGNDSKHDISVKVKATYEVIAPKCLEDGKIIYTATFTEDWATEQTKEVAGKPATDHDWGEVNFEWSSDNTECTAEKICKNDSTHMDVETVTVTKEEIAPKCLEDGKIIYTATFTADWVTEKTQTKEVTGKPATDHDWGEVEYTWANDGSSCTATRTCKNDSSHVETSNANIKKEEKTPETCTEKGWTLYTAIFPHTWAISAEPITKEIQDIPATDHDWSVSYEWEKEGEDWYCTAYRKCGNDSKHDISVKVKATYEVIDPKCLEDGEIICTADFEEDWTTDQTKTVDGESKLGHDWGKWEVVKRPTYKKEGLKERECKRDNCGEIETAPIAKLRKVQTVVVGENKKENVKVEVEVNPNTGAPVFSIVPVIAAAAVVVLGKKR